MNRITGQDVESIRKALDLTQEELARELAISVSTVNRWERGHNKPGRMAQTLLSQMRAKAAARSSR